MNNRCPRLFDDCYPVNSSFLNNDELCFSCVGINDGHYRYCYKNIPEDIVLNLTPSQIGIMSNTISKGIRGITTNLPYNRVTLLDEDNYYPYLPGPIINKLKEPIPYIFKGIGTKYIYQSLLYKGQLIDGINIINKDELLKDSSLLKIDVELKDNKLYPKYFLIKEKEHVTNNNINNIPRINLNNIWLNKDNLYRLLIKKVIDTLIKPDDIYGVNYVGDPSDIVNGWFSNNPINLRYGSRKTSKDIALFIYLMLKDSNNSIHPEVFLKFYSSLFRKLSEEEGVEINNKLIYKLMSEISEYALSKVYLSKEAFKKDLKDITNRNLIEYYINRNSNQYDSRLDKIEEMKKKGLISIPSFGNKVGIPHLYMTLQDVIKVG